MLGVTSASQFVTELTQSKVTISPTLMARDDVLLERANLFVNQILGENFSKPNLEHCSKPGRIGATVSETSIIMNTASTLRKSADAIFVHELFHMRQDCRFGRLSGWKKSIPITTANNHMLSDLYSILVESGAYFVASVYSRASDGDNLFATDPDKILKRLRIHKFDWTFAQTLYDRLRSGLVDPLQSTWQYYADYLQFQKRHPMPLYRSGLSPYEYAAAIRADMGESLATLAFITNGLDAKKTAIELYSGGFSLPYKICDRLNGSDGSEVSAILLRGSSIAKRDPTPLSRARARAIDMLRPGLYPEDTVRDNIRFALRKCYSAAKQKLMSA